LLEVWQQQDLQIETFRAQSNWIWSSLNIERVLGKHQGLAQDSSKDRTLPAVELASLLFTTYQITNAPIQEGTIRRSAYLMWVKESVLGPRLNSDTTLEDDVSGALQQLISNILVKERDDSFAITYSLPAKTNRSRISRITPIKVASGPYFASATCIAGGRSRQH